MMFANHVSKDLSAYLHGELKEERSSATAAHLLKCAACRREFDEIRLGANLAGVLRLETAPDELWNDIERKLHSPRVVRRQQRKISALWAIPAAAALLLTIGLVRILGRPDSQGWPVTPLAGAPRIGSEQLTAAGHLDVGDWLRTDSGSRARLDVADIGRLTVEPDSKLRLLETGRTGHRVELERGAIEAFVTAPPRLFFVETPSAVAVDLGCAYRLVVDEAGAGLLEVRSGWVAFEDRGRESLVPAGAACLTMPGVGPGTPCFTDASPTLKQAIRQFDFEKGGLEALHAILAEARPRDTLSLWHLLSRVDGPDRGDVYESMAALSPPPAGVTREKIEELDRRALEKWKNDLRRVW